MALTNRDKAIIADLNRFRVMDRDSIAELHFGHLKYPNCAANSVLLRLLREGHIQRSTAFTPYVYFSGESKIKKDSAKIGHFLAILNAYKEIRQHGRLDTFLIEPKYGEKGVVEPDIFCIYRKTPFFIELQRTVYSEKQMAEKLERYLALYQSGVIALEPWQNPKRIMFPHVLILSAQRYGIRNYPYHVFQAASFTEFLRSLKVKTPAV
ncbi:hypothetical protein ABES25_04640 [Bacillus gobiensis]|uniref:hypothetical protein n=1 Tax=Bacillus gobiensis TaxID=1441095 RepID=UPI003D1E7676